MGLRAITFVIGFCLWSESALAASTVSCAQSFHEIAANAAVERNFEVWKSEPKIGPRKVFLPLVKAVSRMAFSFSLREKKAIFQWQSKILSELYWKPNYWELRQSTKNSLALMAASWNSGYRIRDMRAFMAFSFLHPLVDGPLDRGEISERTISRVRQKLSGVDIDPESDFERDLFKLLGMIHDVYPREEHPMLSWLLLNIFEAQIESSRIQRSKESTFDELLKMSLRKGGICLALSYYISSGPLSNADFDFAMKQGGLFQLLDDLGDVIQDADEGTRTLFTDDFNRDNYLDRLKRLVAIQESIVAEANVESMKGADVSSVGIWFFLGRAGRFPQSEMKPAIDELSASISPFARFLLRTSMAIHAKKLRENLPRILSEKPVDRTEYFRPPL